MTSEGDFAEDWDAIHPPYEGYKDLRGRKYGRLTVVEKCGADKDGSALWLCQCECGETKIVSRANLRKGRVKSCGCLRRRRKTSK